MSKLCGCFECSGNNPEPTEEEYKLYLVKIKELRMVGNQRKRKLRKKGRSVWWDKDLLSWVWSKE
jgi:hypothetical protein